MIALLASTAAALLLLGGVAALVALWRRWNVRRATPPRIEWMRGQSAPLSEPRTVPEIIAAVGFEVDVGCWRE